MAAGAQALLASRDGSSNSLSSLGLAGGSHPNLASVGSLGLPRGPSGARGASGSSPGRTPSSASLASGAGLLTAGSQHLSASQLLAVQACCHLSKHRGWQDGRGAVCEMCRFLSSVCNSRSVC